VDSGPTLALLCLALAAIAAVSCSPPIPVDGDVDADADGGDADADGDGDADADGDGDADGDADIDADADADSGFCPANNDSIIQAGEAVPVLGASLTYLVNGASATAPVDLVGEVVDGVTTWSFETERTGDRRVELTVLDPSTFWFGEEFADATYAEIVPGFETAASLYRVSDQGVELLGMASMADQTTLVTYDPPVFVIRFPAGVGRTWTEESHATGRIANIAYNADETWEIEVDAAGEVITPAGPYPVVRVRTEMDRLAGPLSDHRINYAFVAECWGRVAYVGSGEGETDPNFAEADELWRLTLR
jgi:hypothetical protein